MFKKKKKKYSSFQKYEYTIENSKADKVYREQCSKLFYEINGLIDNGVYVANDGASMHFYKLNYIEITVTHEPEFSEVYISSPIDIGSYIIEPYSIEVYD